MSDKSDMYKRLSELVNSKQIELPNIVMNTQWESLMKNHRPFGIDFAMPESKQPDIAGVKISYSDFVETGTAYIVNQPRRWGKSSIQVTQEVQQRVIDSIDRITRQTFLYGDAYFEQVREYNWHKFPDESVLDWGNRLSKKGLLDNPDIRWEYQKAILSTIIAPLKRLSAIGK